MTWQANGNVGIGTTAPTTTLEVVNTNTTAFQSTINVSSNPSALSSAGFNGVNPDILKASSGIQFLGWNGKKEGGIFRQTGSNDKSHMLFTVNTTNDVAMVINEHKRVGMGTLAPVTTLHVENTLAATNSINANAQVLRLSRPTTSGTKWDNIAQFDLGSYTNNTVNATSRLDLGLTNGDNNSTISKVMTWQANGNVGIGTTAPSSILHLQTASETQTTPATLRIENNTAPTVNNFAGILFKSTIQTGSWKIGANQQSTTSTDQSFRFLVHVHVSSYVL
jgi:hypothetical protein